MSGTFDNSIAYIRYITGKNLLSISNIEKKK